MGKSVLITGSSSGFGLMTAKTLAKAGHSVFATMRNVDSKNKEAAQKLEDWAKENNAEIHVVELDVTSDDSVNAAVDKVVDTAGKIDVVVNNAGFGIMGLMETLTIDQAKAQFDVNVFGILRVNKAVLPHMRKAGSGLIIHISSGLGRVVLPFMGMYTATKFAVEAIGETYSYELKKLGIDSVIIQPGAYPTDFSGKMILGKDEAVLNEYGPMKEAQEGMFSGFEKMFENAGDPQEIPDLVKEYIDMPSDQRPLRMNKGMMSEGAGVINEVSAKVQEQALAGIGMK